MKNRMKMEELTNEREAQKYGEELADRCILWTAIAAGFICLAACSMVCPLVYVWLFGLVGCVAIGCGTIAVLATMDGFSGAIFGPQMIRGAFELVGLILQGLVAVSR